MKVRELGLLALHPAWPGASPAELAAHDAKSAELAAYKLGRISADDDEGYHRVGCPAAAGKLRCALKPDSMTLGFERPEVLTPPSGQPPRCCAQITITVPPSVNAKTRQKHDYPSLAYRRSYARRTGVERSFSTLKDPASTDVRRGWCRLMGRTKNLLMLVCAVVVRNLRVLVTRRDHIEPFSRVPEPSDASAVRAAYRSVGRSVDLLSAPHSRRGTRSAPAEHRAVLRPSELRNPKTVTRSWFN